MAVTRRRNRQSRHEGYGSAVVEMLRSRLTGPLDKRSHSEFLADYRVLQAAGKLANPQQTTALLDRLERAT